MEPVKIVKLVTGEEVLTQIKELPDQVKLIKPRMLVMQQQGLQMIPWLMLSKDEEVMIKKDKIVMMYEPRDEILNGYREQVGGIVTAPANALDGKGKLQL